MKFHHTRLAWKRFRNRFAKAALHCIGDSHASFFGGADMMQPSWPKPAKNRFPFFRCYRLGPVLAYSLSREGSTSKGRERLFEVLSTLPHGADVLLCFGEIDCRAQLSKQAEKANRDVGELVDECVASYVAVGREVTALGFNIAYWQVPPPTTMVRHEWEFPAVGSYEEHLAITLRFNASLAAAAAEAGHGWLSVFEKLTNSEGRPRANFFLDGIHLSQQAMPVVREAAKAVFPHLNFNHESPSMIPARKLSKIERANHRAALFPAWNDFNERLKLLKYAKRWQKDGWSLPLPDLMKRSILSKLAKDHGAEVFVETGTFRGDTPWCFRDDFRKIFSIEVQPQLAQLAAKRFSAYPHIEIVEGDSVRKLAEIIPKIDGPVLFWLDGHYSAGVTGRGDDDCPLWGELHAINGNLAHPFGIIVDDARCFGANDGYPTLEELRTYVSENLPNHRMSVENDLIRITPAS